MTTINTTYHPSIAKLIATYDVSSATLEEFSEVYEEAIVRDLVTKKPRKSEKDFVSTMVLQITDGIHALQITADEDEETLMRRKMTKIVRKELAENRALGSWQKLQSVWSLHCAYFQIGDVDFLDNLKNGIMLESLSVGPLSVMLSFLPLGDRAVFYVSKTWRKMWQEVEKESLSRLKIPSVTTRCQLYPWLTTQLPQHPLAKKLALSYFSSSLDKMDANILAINDMVFEATFKARWDWFSNNLIDLSNLVAIPRNFEIVRCGGVDLLLSGLSLGSIKNQQLLLPNNCSVQFRESSIDGSFSIGGCNQTENPTFSVAFSKSVINHLPLLQKNPVDTSSYANELQPHAGCVLHFVECNFTSNLIATKGLLPLNKIWNRTVVVLEKCTIHCPELVTGIIPQNNLVIDKELLSQLRHDAALMDKEADVRLVNCQILPYDSP